MDFISRITIGKIDKNSEDDLNINKLSLNHQESEDLDLKIQDHPSISEKQFLNKRWVPRNF